MTDPRTPSAPGPESTAGPDDLLLARPVEVVARRLALGHLRRAVAARARMADPADAEALHDFRVAIRRLRSTVRGFRPELGRSVRRRLRRKLRALVRATGPVRDLEVHAAWIDAELPRLNPREREGALWLLGRFGEERRRAEAELETLLEAGFPRLVRRLERRLTRYRATLPEAGWPASAGEALAPRILAQGRELAVIVEEIRARGSEAAHVARIAAKRLRYLLEPFAAELGSGLVDRLRALQDDLGELHDAQVFAAELEALEPDAPEIVRPGLAALRGRVLVRGAAAFDRFARTWLDGGSAEFLAEFEAAAAGCGAPREIERKYLLSALPRLPREHTAQEIEQGWLPGTRLMERLRRVCDASGARCYRTVKIGAGLVRVELEEETDQALFEYLWPLTLRRRIRKRRYRVPDGGLVWEIDEFLDRDLVLAEVELREPVAVEPPPWLAPLVVREVTGDAEYVNRNLAR